MLIVHFDPLKKLCLVCIGPCQNCEFCFTLGSTKYKPRAVYCTLDTYLLRVCSALFFCSLYFVPSLAWLRKRQRTWADSTRPKGAGKIIRRTKQPNSSTTWICSAVYDRDRCGRVTFLTRLTPSDHLVTAQPSPAQSGPAPFPPISPFHALTFLSSY